MGTTLPKCSKTLQIEAMEQKLNTGMLTPEREPRPSNLTLLVTEKLPFAVPRRPPKVTQKDVKKF